MSRDWEAGGTDGGLHSVFLCVMNTTAMEAAQMAVGRARTKYGTSENVTRWRFFVRQRGEVSTTRHFRVGANGRAVRVDD